MTVEVVPLTRPDLLTAAPTADVLALQRDYLALCAALLDDGDFQDGVKKKSAWRKLAAAFNVSDTILERHYDYDDTGRIVRAEFVVLATAPNGRSSVGVGLASRHDRKFNNPEHDIPATAHTRAKNRACSDLFGLGEVSAEEIDKRDRSTRSGDVAPNVAVGIQGTEALENRLLALSFKARTAFKDWRRSRGLVWPPTTTADLMTMTGEVARIEAEVRTEDDAYGSSASGSDAHTTDTRRRRHEPDKSTEPDNGGTENAAPGSVPLYETAPDANPHVDSPAPPTPTLGTPDDPAQADAEGGADKDT